MCNYRIERNVNVFHVVIQDFTTIGGELFALKSAPDLSLIEANGRRSIPEFGYEQQLRQWRACLGPFTASS